MGSRKEEERNEKIIRGLMKLPPNRRCINCNSLGPQYVCTNFWTFVCMTCSGIHREFTHRVKSVSMAKFTSQEVEALQNGGNQRAREMYLKDWDPQRQRFPDSSNAVKVREFIKNVYMDKKYAGGKTSDKPPRDMQSHKSFEDETRRASSYHSYSQSPPYDYQYEERRYGKQAAALTRKPGSDQGHYVRKISSFVYSRGHLSDQMFEDRFANEGSGSRVSDYSVSSGGEPFRSGTESPNFQKDNGFSSPPIQPSRDILSENAQQQTINLFSEANFKRETDRIPRPQKTKSFGSSGSFDSNSMSIKSYNSGSLADVVSEPEQPAESHQDKMYSFPQSSAPVNYGGLDLFNAPVVPESDSTGASPIDLFQLPATSLAPSVDMFQPSTISPAPSMDSYQLSQTYPSPSVDLFVQIAEFQPAAKPAELSVHKNEGWAMFDTPQPAALPGTENISPAKIPSDGDSSVKSDQVSSLSTSIQWLPFQSSSADKPASSISSPWHGGLPSVQVPAVATCTQSWNAFDDSIKILPLEGVEPTSKPPVAAYKPSSTADHHLGLRVLEDSCYDVIQRAAHLGEPPSSGIAANIVTEPSYIPSIIPPMGEETQPHADDRKSTNPFDLPYDSELEQSTMFLDMSSLQAALPNAQLPPTFLGDVSQTWFPQNLLTPCIPAVPQGGLAYMAGQAPSSQLQNVPTQGPVASIGGNPFA